MTFDQIIVLKDEDEKMKEIREFGDFNNLTKHQKIDLISTLRKPENKIELLSNRSAFDIEVCIHALRVNFDESEKLRIATDARYAKLRELIKNTDLSLNNIQGIIDAYKGRKEVLNLFDSTRGYYKDNENIILRGTSIAYDDAVVTKIMDMEGINISDRNHIKKSLQELFNVNEEILQTVNFSILKKKYDRLGPKLSIITLYPELQQKIISLSNKELDFLCKSIDYLNALHIDWIPLVDGLTSNIKDYSNIVNNDIGFSRFVKNIEVGKGRDSDVMRILSIMTDRNKFDYKNFGEMMKSSRADRINNALDKNFFKLTEVEQHKALVCLKLFGMDYKDVKKLFEYFGQDYERTIAETDKTPAEVSKYLEKVKGLKAGTKEHKIECDKILQSNKEVKLFLKAVKKIMDSENIADLKSMYERAGEVYDMPRCAMDSTFRQFFARLKLDSLYMPDDKDKIIVDGEEVYLIPPGKCWQITSLEAYTKYNGEKADIPDWNVKRIKNHIISTVFGSSKNMSLPPIKGICYGLAGYDERALLKSAPWDLGGWEYAEDFEVYRKDSVYPAKFCTPQSTQEQTLRRHGEDIVERSSYNYEKDKVFKLQPAYTTSFVELPLEKYFKRRSNDSEVLTAEVLKSLVDQSKMDDMVYRSRLIEDELKNDPKWKKTKADAKKKGIKKTAVDRTHDLIFERLKMDEKETQLLNYTRADLNDPKKMNEFLNLVQEIIVEFDEVRAGNIQTEFLGEWRSDGSSKQGDLLHKEMHDRLFSYKVMDDKLTKIENKFKTLGPDKYKVCMRAMKKICKEQADKLDNQYWWYECDTSHDWYHYYNYAARQLTGITYKKEHDIIQNLLDQNVSGMSMTGGQAVKKVIEEIKNIREYDIPKGEPDWHGRRHINNVVLFSYLIAQKENKLGNNMDLLLQAAKYHDVGRDGVWNGLGAGKRHDMDEIPHAYPSALAAQFYMSKELNSDGSRKYTDEQIAMVKVAIAYHEVREKNKNEFSEELFARLCEKEHVRPEDVQTAKLISIYLKDADALDRTRFIYPTKNTMYHTQYPDGLDYRYLRTDTAIALRDYARSINDVHFKNGRGSEYIPKELDKYAIPHVGAPKDWTRLKQEIRTFLGDKDIKGDLPKLTREDVEDIVMNPKDKGLFFRIRNKIKQIFKFFKKSKTKKQSNKRSKNPDDYTDVEL